MALSPLPPLHTLIAFEATVRLGSFTRAGEELNLTQSAVSRQIATLEQSLGRTLILRNHNGLTLTTAGERYLHRVRYLLEECADATAKVMRHAGENEINLACSSGIAQFWVPQRLAAFRKAYPDIRFNLIMRDGITTLSGFEFDVGMYYLKQSNIIHFDTIRLFDEEMFPVCSPEYLAGRNGFTPQELLSETLLVLEDAQRQPLSAAYRTGDSRSGHCAGVEAYHRPPAQAGKSGARLRCLSASGRRILPDYAAAPSRKSRHPPVQTLATGI
jgi:DNA-binding transcriptional LysR family regulator